MWRWVTRGLVVAFLCSLLAPALLAQGFIGAVDLPDPGITQTGMILVRGWAYDQQQISKIELYVDDVFQWRVNQGIPRIDIIEAYPNYPGIHNSAPGFQTGILASRFTNGPHTISMKAFYTDRPDHIVEFGRRTINIDNTINQPPFGSVDIPDPSGIYNAAGSFPVVGWVADTDGIARVDVQIDEGNMQSAMYGDSRPDVGNSFPDFPGALFSGFVGNIDTTRIQDGVHTLTVRATDRLGVSRMIGRRTVQILNSEGNLKPFGYLDEPKRDAILVGTNCGTIPIISPPVNPRSHITPVRGWALDLGTRNDVGRIGYAELLIDGVRWISTDDCGLVLGRYANCYGLPRYDVQRFYPTYPDAPRAGFFFTLDVGALMARGVRPGNHVLKVRVADQQQTFTDIPGPAGIPVWFSCAEQINDFPSEGFIDVPTTYDYVTGDVVFQGWAIEEVGSVAAVEIIIDGNYIGQAIYGFPRTDVADEYPFVFNANLSGWRFTMDTRKLSNARHRLTVRVLDAFGNRSEIGSVDFYVQNLAVTP